ncbi:MAG: 30S ribosomal protein S12 methylthiotransferase RimO [Flavobacteriales bacterium]|jgi:ribosomal protein S12 methylthiotransferase|nr:30S ribosomal protein S12 methylthiotransferase RimO [Flavobacteriales bacterium]MBT3677933.1 30S ribosomal protein S12 methylthiotransferase RimO [Flavobacteriales bacterium]MBT3740506.1 30S ribosomal protein S12 methylthiotransferase RimO [Flavobacteriales bacterium]MBT4528879.1 30S ribosomal protein S12 methylthiotransferase RimO [Flavobacteriales bacterium]MBT5024951.1 30S ribosomal protein S12 methylthiotransferase RimO [Flavobacteriales bacterium]
MRARTTKKQVINVITLGCSKNLHDSEVLMGQLQANGKEVVHEKEGEIVVVNTCGFIDNAKQESIDTILDAVRAKERGDIEKVFVTGCLSERYMSDLEVEIPDVDRYFGTRDLPLLLKALGADYKKELVGERLVTTPQHYAYLKIAEGCDRPCSFCAIPLMRGKHISKPIEDLVIETEKLATKGVVELILIAQDLTYYGLDIYKKRNLAELITRLSDVEGIAWIRLHYLYPSGFPEDVLSVIADNDKVCNYIDIPLQHISDAVLKSMRRGTTMKKTNALLANMRATVPDMAIRSTLIVGYPGETEEDFATLLAWVKSQRFERLGVFTYSHEENTHAFALEDDVDHEVKLTRQEAIMNAQRDISLERNQSLVGQRMICLVDRQEGELTICRSQYDSPDVDNEIHLQSGDIHLKSGSFVEVEIVGASDYDLSAVLR